MNIGLQPVNIRGDLFSEREIRRIINNTLNGVAKDIEIDFKVTTQTWNNKPSFKIQRISDFEYIIGTDDLIYKFVSGGTRVRYATMTPDFSPKTQVKTIASRTGRGGMAYISRKKPRPGIQARQFDIEIAKKWKRLVVSVFNRAVASELSRR